MNLGRHLAYLKYVVRHKWFVFLEGRKMGVPLLNLILHDWTKFLPVEWGSYARAFYQPDGKGWYKPDPAFFVAWNHHQKHNRHHWQYWLLALDQPAKTWHLQSMDDAGPFILARDGKAVADMLAVEADSMYHEKQYELAMQIVSQLNTLTPIEMPDVDRREMLADWRGAGRTRFGDKADCAGWYKKNHRFIHLHPNTRAWVEDQLGVTAEMDAWRRGEFFGP